MIIIFIALAILLILIFYNKYNKEGFNNENNLLVVSGYWNIKNKHDNLYNKWFKNTLNINQTYVFYCDKDINDYILSFRNGYETIFVNYPLNNFFSKNYIHTNEIHEIHVPSKELGYVWNEKMHLLKITKDNDKNNTEYYIWIDAGISIYRDDPPPNKKLIINTNIINQKKLYYSEVNESYHNFAAGVILIHRDVIDEIHDKYYNLLNSCQDEWKCNSEQYIFTKLILLYPELFYKLTNGYGEMLNKIFDMS
jgi:hypothetical protein